MTLTRLNEIAWLASKISDVGLICMLARAEAFGWPTAELVEECSRRGLT